MGVIDYWALREAANKFRIGAKHQERLLIAGVPPPSRYSVDYSHGPNFTLVNYSWSFRARPKDAAPKRLFTGYCFHPPNYTRKLIKKVNRSAFPLQGSIYFLVFCEKTMVQNIEKHYSWIKLSTLSKSPCSSSNPCKSGGPIQPYRV